MPGDWSSLVGDECVMFYYISKSCTISRDAYNAGPENNEGNSGLSLFDFSLRSGGTRSRTCQHEDYFVLQQLFWTTV